MNIEYIPQAYSGWFSLHLLSVCRLIYILLFVTLYKVAYGLRYDKMYNTYTHSYLYIYCDGPSGGRTRAVKWMYPAHTHMHTYSYTKDIHFRMSLFKLLIHFHLFQYDRISNHRKHNSFIHSLFIVRFA